VAYCDGFSELSLAEVIETAHHCRIPVIVDAAASLPPKANLTRFIEAGADLVIYSGGKGIRGPQSSGILCGRRELIASAALQCWDLDCLAELWDPPAEWIESSFVAGGVPNHGIGRGLKVGKEEIVGLWTALERFNQLDEVELGRRLRAIAAQIADGLSGISTLEVKLSESNKPWPRVELKTSGGDAGKQSAIGLARQLADGDPSIQLGQGFARSCLLHIDPFCLRPGDPEEIIARIRRLVGTH